MVTIDTFTEAIDRIDYSYESNRIFIGEKDNARVVITIHPNTKRYKVKYSEDDKIGCVFNIIGQERLVPFCKVIDALHSIVQLRIPVKLLDIYNPYK